MTTDTDLWHIRECPTNAMNKIKEILGEHVEFENVTEEFADKLNYLAEQIFISIEPVLRNKPEFIEIWNLEIDCKEMNSAIVNYIESAVIKDKLVKWIQEETGTKIIGCSFIRRFNTEENPKDSLDAETKTLQHHIEIAQECYHGGPAYFVRNYSAKETEAVTNAVQNYLDTVKNECTAWNEKTELQLFKGLVKIIPGTDTHNRHVIALDITQWFCMKHRLAFYPADELYFTNDKEVAERPREEEIKDRLVTNIHHRYCMDCLRFPTEKGTAAHVQKAVSMIRKLTKEDKDFAENCLMENDPEYLGIHIAKDLQNYLEGNRRDESAQKEFIETIDNYFSSYKYLKTNAGDVEKHVYCIYERLFSETGEPILIRAEPDDETTEWGLINPILAEKDTLNIRRKVSCKAAAEKAVSRGIREIKPLSEAVTQILPFFRRYENKSSNEEDISEEELNAAAEKLAAAFAGTIPDSSITDSVTGCYLKAALDNCKYTHIFDEEEYHAIRFTLAQNLFTGEEAFTDAMKKIADVIRNFSEDSADIILINKTAMEIVTAAETVRKYMGGFTAKAHMYLKSVLGEFIPEGIKRNALLYGDALKEIIYETLCREYSIPPYLKELR